MVAMDERRTVLFLISDTGAGHRRAAEAVIEALAAGYPDRYRAVLCDPLTGPAAAPSLRWLARLYGPAVRLAPWAWGAAYYVSNSRPAMAVLWRTAFAPATAVVAAECARSRPDVIVSCHPLTGRAALLAAGPRASRIPVVTVVTDLVATHASWRYPPADVLAVPSAQAAVRFLASGRRPGRCVQPGLPVEARAQAPVPSAAARARLRHSLGLPERAFVVLLAGGGEGCGGLARRTAAILAQDRDVHVVTACGRNDRVQRRLTALARGAGGRLTVLGFAGNFTDWLRCADVVLTKAVPGIIAEAACCRTPMLLTSHLPGQERGNARLVVSAGAGRRARGVGAMVRELARLRADPGSLAALRAGGQVVARPRAAAEIAALVAGLAPSGRDAAAGTVAPAASGHRPAAGGGSSSGHAHPEPVASRGMGS
jgi:1,2-diacylglycerol 3-beta-galactosyltransferase